MKRSPLTIIVALLLIAIFGLMLFVFQVRQSEVAVVTLFERMEMDNTRTNPGPHLQWPWPIERVYKLDQRVHSLEDKLEPIKLPDQNIIMLMTYVGWRIADPASFFPKFENGSIAAAESQLEGIVRSAKLEVAGRHTFSDFLSADQGQIKLDQIENEILASARQRIAAGNYGVEIKFLQIKSIELPSAVSQAVFDRMKAERSKLVNAIQANAQERSIEIRSQADSEASTLLAEADAGAKKIRGEGEQAMIQSLQVMDQNPAFARFLMDLNMMEELSKDKTTWILDSHTTGLELLQAAKAPEAATNAPVPARN
jgi:membrane protease subunit HflC